MARKSKKSDRMAVQDASKTLLANIRFASIDSPIKTLTFTSTLPSEGKSTVAFNLARAAATSGSRTILVECDMRHRTLSGLLGVRGTMGLYAVLSGRASLDEAVVSTQQKGLDFLDVEPGIPNPADVLSSKRFGRLIKDLCQGYDYVFFDTPPVGVFVDAAVLSSLTDGTVFVVRQNYTKREAAREAIEQLRKGGANVLGTVMNFCERPKSGSYYYDYEPSDEQADAADLPELPRESHARMTHANRTTAPRTRDDDRNHESHPTPAPKAPRSASPSETAAFVMAAEASRANSSAARSQASSQQPPRPTSHAAAPTTPPRSQAVSPSVPVINGTGAAGAHRVYQPQPNPYVRRK